MLDYMSFKSNPYEINPQFRVFAVGADKPELTIDTLAGGRRRPWGLCCEIIAEHFDCSPDDVTAPDVYWGGEYGDANSIEVVMVAGKIVGALDQHISADDVAAIYASASNDHASLSATALSE